MTRDLTALHSRLVRIFLSDCVHKRVFTSLKKFVRLILFPSTIKLVAEETQDLSVFPTLLYLFLVVQTTDAVKVNSKCFRSMRKSEPPHILEVSSKTTDGSLFGRCSCVTGAGGHCHHVIGLLYHLALLKQLGHRILPDELTCTSIKHRWSFPKRKKIEQKEEQNVQVKKPQLRAS